MITSSNIAAAIADDIVRHLKAQQQMPTTLADIKRDRAAGILAIAIDYVGSTIPYTHAIDKIAEYVDKLPPPLSPQVADPPGSDISHLPHVAPGGN